MLKEDWLLTSNVLHSGPKRCSEVSVSSLLTYNIHFSLIFPDVSQHNAVSSLIKVTLSVLKAEEEQSCVKKMYKLKREKRDDTRHEKHPRPHPFLPLYSFHHPSSYHRSSLYFSYSVLPLSSKLSPTLSFHSLCAAGGALPLVLTCRGTDSVKVVNPRSGLRQGLVLHTRTSACPGMPTACITPPLRNTHTHTEQRGHTLISAENTVYTYCRATCTLRLSHTHNSGLLSSF